MGKRASDSMKLPLRRRNVADDTQYEVGYRKPPKSGQFQAGKSGNPRGRPRGSKNLASIVLRESRQTVKMNGPRGCKKVTKLEASVMQLDNKAAQGDLSAQREYFRLIQLSEESTNANPGPLGFHEVDHQVMQNIVKRMWSVQADDEEFTPEGTK